MRRREFLLEAGAMTLGFTGAAAQEPGRVFRLAVVGPTAQNIATFRAVTLPELDRLGFALGRSLVVEERTGPEDRLAGMARDLVAWKPDAIVAIANPGVQAARAATETIPIVSYGPDPVGLGFAASAPQPGGNLTGIVIASTELDAKRVQLLAEAVPNARRIGAIVHASTGSKEVIQNEMRLVASRLGLELVFAEVTRAEDYPAAFAGFRTSGVQALAIMAHALLFRDGALLAGFAVEAGLPSICEWREMAEQGCLIGYGPNRVELYRRVGALVARIFQGASPGSLPIERPMQFELAINMKTGNALGLTLAPSLLARADEVIE
jgi:putative tryptophan/tyrosine transport system substrate-binding protein